MKNSQTLISKAEESPEGFDAESLSVHAFGSPAAAQDFVLRNLRAESEDLETPLKPASGDVTDIFHRKEGSFSYRIGDHTYHIRYLNTPAEYNTSDEEMRSTLDAYCNMGRSASDYARLANDISSGMHRYIQNELWKFVKAIIGAFAAGGCDERNRTARIQARILQSVIETDPEF